MLPGEIAEASVKRHFAGHTEKTLSVRCVLAPYRGAKPPSGAKRYTFVPNAALRKELRRRPIRTKSATRRAGLGHRVGRHPILRGAPASRARKVLFVRVGQDEPLFDEKTLRLIGP